ncbi:MAG: alginate export family protein [Cytophagales bacterium]|nr:alginate export family protein [Cytophagales bacterium]
MRTNQLFKRGINKVMLVPFFMLFMNFYTLAQQQLTLSGGFRFLPIHSRGFREPLGVDDKAGTYVQQVTRFNVAYEDSSYKAFVMLQDTRIWGEPSFTNDPYKLGVYRAWVEKKFTNNLSLEIGRNEFKYDDQHLLGAREWARNLAHDGVRLKYENDSTQFKAHAMFAYSANGVEFSRQEYGRGNYKSFHALWLNKEYKSVKSSLIYIGRGQDKDSTTTTVYTHTFGTNTKFSITPKLTLTGIYYHQLGKNQQDQDVNAFLTSVNLKYEINKKFSYTIGTDIGSGTAANTTETENNTFDRMFGLLHGYFGYTDLFYVRRPATEGVEDYYLKLLWKHNKKFSIKNHIHWFRTQQAFGNNHRELGFENNIVFNYKFSKDATLSLGHAIFFGGKHFEEYWGKEIKETQMLFMMFSFRPTFFKKSF